jgi:DNA (cytosine-5)-methyltransferase 1
LWDEIPDLNGQPYGKWLDAAWGRHVAERAPDAPTVVSTFAGCGGSSLGYSMAGYRELAAVEWDKNACAVFRRNFPGVRVLEGDIRRTAVEAVGVAPGELDVLDGSPPCQGFSDTRGRNDVGDERNQLFREFVRFLEGLRPRFFVMENVVGMSRGKRRKILVEAMSALRGAGYEARVWTINAQWYAVPQHRPRLIFIGSRDDLGLHPSPPPPETRPISFSRAVVGCPATSAEDLAIATACARTEAIAPRLRMCEPGDRFCKKEPDKHYWGWNRCHPARPVWTLTASAFGFGGAFHPDGERHLTVEEAARLSSFPDQFDLGGGHPRARWALIGNSVPPLFMEAIARHVRRTMIDKEV